MILFHDHPFYAWQAFQYENIEISEQLIKRLEDEELFSLF